MEGLGIRELVIQGKDLLILAGPSMDLDGPVFDLPVQGAKPPEIDIEGLDLEAIAFGC